MSIGTLVARLLKRLGLARKGTIVVGPASGLRFDPGPSNADYASGDNELPVQGALAECLRGGDVFYDVGANVGFLTVLGARLVGPSGTVYAFEPVPANAGFVRRNAQANGFAQVHVIEKAVSNRLGAGELTLARYSGGSALASAEPPPDADGTLPVELVTIDDLVGRELLKPPDVVKIDVEGAELEVLEGMATTAATHRPVVIVEVDAADADALARKQDACERWLQARGYRTTLLPDSYPHIRWQVRHIVAAPV